MTNFVFGAMSIYLLFHLLPCPQFKFKVRFQSTMHNTVAMDTYIYCNPIARMKFKSANDWSKMAANEIVSAVVALQTCSGASGVKMYFFFLSIARERLLIIAIHRDTYTDLCELKPSTWYSLNRKENCVESPYKNTQRAHIYRQHFGHTNFSARRKYTWFSAVLHRT